MAFTLLAMNDSFPLANADDSEGENPLRSMNLFPACFMINVLYVLKLFIICFYLIIEYSMFYIMFVLKDT